MDMYFIRYSPNIRHKVVNPFFQDYTQTVLQHRESYLKYFTRWRDIAHTRIRFKVTNGHLMNGHFDDTVPMQVGSHEHHDKWVWFIWHDSFFDLFRELNKIYVKYVDDQKVYIQKLRKLKTDIKNVK